MLFSFQAFSQELSSEERKLYNLIMDYRKVNGLPSIPLSTSLTFVSKKHCEDLVENIGYLTHAWSDCPYDPKDRSTYECMWLKPSRLTKYKGYGYECAHGGSGGYIATAESSLNGWKNSNRHNDVILNQDIWENKKWNAIGVGILNNYAVIWFGEERDGEQIVKPKYPDQSPALIQVPTTVRVPAPNPTLKPTPNEPMKSKGYPSEVSSKTKQKSSELKIAPYIFMFSGFETWTKNHDLPLITQMKLKQDINFTGASPVFQLNATLPKKPGNKINDIRGVFSIGFTLSNSILQNEFGQAIGNYQSSPRLYSPVYYDFGLQCWKYFQINVGQTIFGLMGTSNTLDYAVLNRCGLRFIIPMGRNLTISVHGSYIGQTVDISNWSMASVGVSLRSKFY
jgi:hypothetical protein